MAFLNEEEEEHKLKLVWIEQVERGWIFVHQMAERGGEERRARTTMGRRTGRRTRTSERGQSNQQSACTRRGLLAAAAQGMVAMVLVGENGWRQREAAVVVAAVVEVVGAVMVIPLRGQKRAPSPHIHT